MNPEKMTRKHSLVLLMVFMLLPLAHGYSRSENTEFRQEMTIPIDTSDPNSKYYPVDMRVEFEHRCWARDELNRSVRVFVYHKGRYREIESQIYNLNFSDDEHIRSCNIVFLIPSFADGSERYFVFYSSEPTPPPRYKDHVSLIDSRFYYEPITGYKADVRYYLIKEEGYAPFSVCYDGSVLGLRFPQRIIKLKEDARDISLNNWLVATTYAFLYLDRTRLSGSVGSMERLIDKKVLIDGNLMVRFGIETESPDGNMLTRNIYTYYYCPTSDKRIIVSSYQKIKQERTADGVAAQGGNIVTMITSIIRSANIEELNTGLFIPYIHFLSEENFTKEYRFPKSVSGTKRRWIILPKDDEDLSKRQPWISMDFGEKGDTFALIFTSSNPFSIGREGLQITAGLAKWIDMPGLLIQGMGFSVGRNSYESGEKEITKIPSGLEVSFTSEFYYTKKGYGSVGDEAERFAKAFSTFSTNMGWEREREIEKETFNLTVIPTLQGLSYPLMAAISRLPIPIVTVEIYKGERLVSSAIVKRYPLIKIEEIPKSLRDLIKAIHLDPKNVSILQEARFPKLERGRYVVKVYLKFGKVSKFVGVKVIDLDGDKICVVRCKPETKLVYRLKDQYGNSIRGANLRIIKDGEVVCTCDSGKDGRISVELPFSSYRVEIFYKNSLVSSEQIKPKDFLPTFHLHRDERIYLYNLKILVLDRFGLMFGDDLCVDLNGIRADFEDGIYVFTKVPRGNYTLRLLYKSFEVKQKICLDRDKEITLEVPITYSLEIEVKDLIGNKLSGCRLVLSREGRKVTESENIEHLQIPPGKYKIDIFKGSRLICSYVTLLSGETQTELFVDENPLIDCALSLAFIILLLVSTFFLIRKNRKGFILLSAIFMIFLSISLPIWELFGEKSGFKVYSKIHLFSQRVYTFKSYQSLSWGEATDLPRVVSSIFNLIIFMMLVDVFLILLHLSTACGRERLSRASILLSILINISIILILYLSLSFILYPSVGSVSGCGELTYSFPDVGDVTILSAWSPGKGFFFILLAVFPKILYLYLYKRNFS